MAFGDNGYEKPGGPEIGDQEAPPGEDIGTTPDADISDDDTDISPNLTADRVRISPPPPGEGVINWSGYGLAIPFTLGRDRISTFWTAGPISDGVSMWMGQGIGWGPIEEIESVIINGVERFSNLTESLHHGVRQSSAFVDCWCTPYFGIPTQGVDPDLAARIPGYADTGVITRSGETRGMAYLVIRIGGGVIDGSPLIEVIVKGLKTTLASDIPGGPVWNDNPAAGLWAWLESPLLGRGLTVDPASVLTIENENNELVQGAKRHTLNLTFQGRSEIEGVQETLSREYADCYVRPAADPQYDLELASARDAVHVMELTETDFLVDGGRPGPKVNGKGTRGQINRAIGIYRKTRATPEPWGEGWVPIDADPLAIESGTMRVTREIVRLEGVHSHEEMSLRMTERLNAWRLETRNFELVMRAKGVKIQRGDIIRLQYPLRGYTDFDVRVAAEPHYLGPGRWRILAHNHAPTKYSVTPVADPDYDIGLTLDPATPPGVTGLACIDEVPQTGVNAGNLVLRITFDIPEWPYYAGFRVQVYGEDDIGGSPDNLVWKTIVSGNETESVELVTPAVSPDGDYRIIVTSISSIGAETAANPLDYTPRGKAIPPHDVERLDADFIDGKVRLVAEYAVDEFDQLGFVFRQSAPGVRNEPWADMAPVRSAAGRIVNVQNEIVIREPGESTLPIEYAVKKIDTLRNQSMNEARAQVLLTGSTQHPAVRFDLWPREPDWTPNCGIGPIGVNHYDVLVPGKGWYIVGEPGGHEFGTRYGTAVGVPAFDPDKPAHVRAGSYDFDFETNYAQATFAVKNMRDLSWQAITGELDEDGNFLPEASEVRSELVFFSPDGVSGISDPGRAIQGSMVSGGASIQKLGFTPTNWGIVIKQPIVVTGRVRVLVQEVLLNSSEAALASGVPVIFDQNGLRNYTSGSSYVTTVTPHSQGAILSVDENSQAPGSVIIHGERVSGSGAITYSVRLEGF